MKEFEYFQSLPLYLISSAYKSGLITADEKRKMKQIIIVNNPEDKFFINDMITDYNKHGTLQTFILKFLSLILRYQHRPYR